jgi:hypothetical protein
MEDKPVDDLMGLVKQIVPFHVKVIVSFRCMVSWKQYIEEFILLQHNAEPEAVDLLMEVRI